eukprot:GHRQ01015183.1.p1 GENE.GHRQ01015183.1~~GHRQ01015183.1.p1  ORF type:complete len:245 (+),score=120.84 GHRQ01015183.1:167-901(+)
MRAHVSKAAVLLLAACAVLLPPCATAAAVGRVQPVRVDYYMEALCPYCANFTITQLQPLFSNKLINYVQLSVIPWGNARVDADGKTTCQHGQLECDLNRLLSCASAQHPAQDDFFPFLACLEEAVLAGGKLQVQQLAHSCAVHAGMVTDKLMACYEGPLGATLQQLAAQRTASLKPPHRWVPWITVNGIPLLDDVDNIQRYICTVVYHTASVRDRPKACLEEEVGPSAPKRSTDRLQQQQQQQQ